MFISSSHLRSAALHVSTILLWHFRCHIPLRMLLSFVLHLLNIKHYNLGVDFTEGWLYPLDLIFKTIFH